MDIPTNTPLTRFANIQQAAAILNEWQIRLGLHDWTIKIKLVEPHEIGEDRDGECEYTETCKSAVIRILKPEYYGDRIIKYCAERILVHELLHCKFSLLDTNNEGFNNLLHQTQEDIARAFICAKYGVSVDWFACISYEGE